MTDRKNPAKDWEPGRLSRWRELLDMGSNPPPDPPPPPKESDHGKTEDWDTRDN